MDERIRKLLAEYADIFPEIPSEGKYNTLTVLQNLKNNIYFASNQELLDKLIEARNDKDLDAMKSILDEAIQTGDATLNVDITAIEKEKGIKLSEEDKSALENALTAINQGEQLNQFTPEQAKEMRDSITNQAFEISPESGTRLMKQADGTLEVFGGYFDNVIFSNIFTQEASVQEIVSFQNYLIENNIATPEDFAGTKGVYSEKLRAIVEGVMDWADQNVNAAEGTPLRNEILGQEPVFFSDVEYQNMDVSFERNLFNYAVKEMAKANVDLKSLELEKQLEAEKIKYLPPRKETLDDMVEAYFVANTGRSPSAKELSDWSTELAKSYSESYTQLERFKYEQEQMNVRLKPTYETSYTVDPTTEQPKRVDTVTGQILDFGGLQEMQPMTPAEIFEAKFEEELGGEMQSWEKGLQIKEMQNKIMSAMYGG